MPRRTLSRSALATAVRIVDLAWADLPGAHRSLLEAIGAHQRLVVDRPLGTTVDELRRSANLSPVRGRQRTELDRALGVCVPELRLIVIDAGHPSHAGLDARTYEAALARIAWHEWGHALALARATAHDVSQGKRLLGLAPAGIAQGIRAAGYRANEYTHELIAETYALLMSRRRRGAGGRPPWLNAEIFDLMIRTTGWSD